MLYSMTGYGKSSAESGGQSFTVEARSLNSKYLDLNLKVPQSFRSKEVAIRNLVSQLIIRGKIEVTISTEQSGESSGSSVINKSLFAAYYKELSELQQQFKFPDTEILSSILRMPDITSQNADELIDETWQKVELAVITALEKLKDFRATEGAELRKDLEERIKLIDNLNTEVEGVERQRAEKIRERITGHLSELLDSDHIDENRLEQEMIFYIEKLDITEEIVRLRSHCEYFIQVMKEETQEKGKKLNFISQEVGREINTIGSKSNDAPMQKLVVQMKEQLEKIKEQLNNVL